jgi:hypothetical protein
MTANLKLHLGIAVFNMAVPSLRNLGSGEIRKVTEASDPRSPYSCTLYLSDAEFVAQITR